MLIVDSQVHLFGPDAQERAARVSQRVMNADDVIRAMEGAGVDRAYLVPAGFAANQACIDAKTRWPDRFRVVGIVPLDKPEGPGLLASWRDLGMLGVRLRFPPFRTSSWLKDGTADWFWPAAEKAGIPVMVWAPGQLDEIARVAQQHPRLKVVVDHLGLFVDDKDEKVVEVVRTLLPLARYENVAVKASGLPGNTSDAYPFKRLHEPIKWAVEAFGPRRVFWGTDLTRLPCSYRQAVDLFTKELDFLSSSDLELIMGQAIIAWFGW